MEVVVFNIPKRLDSKAIERFIYAMLKAERHFIVPIYSYDSQPSHHLLTAAVPIDKGFFFRRIEKLDKRTDIGFITFAKERVGTWFLEYAQQQSFVRNYDLALDQGRQLPSKAFVHAISENATDRQPSTSAKKHAQIFQFGMAHVGYWSAPLRFCSTSEHSCRPLRLIIDERAVIRIELPGLSLSFLPREVRGYNSAFLNEGKASSKRVGAIFLFELRQNPQDSGPYISTHHQHGFRLPSRVIRIAFGADHKGSKAADELYHALESTLPGVTRIDMDKIRMTTEDYNGFVEAFFRRSRNLGIELAFLREALLRNELLSISALQKITPRIDDLIHRGQQELALDVLKNFIPKLEVQQERGTNEEQSVRAIKKLWDEAYAETVEVTARGLLTFEEPIQPDGDDYLSPMLHIDVTPTRILLSGPQYHVSNRVIRAYRKHWYHFARVMFTNEDRESVTAIKANYGFNESEAYIKSRVLDILKYGLTVAGRHWDMLAWSSSSMNTHTIWFVTPFRDEAGRHVDANFIRQSLGEFSDVIRKPAQLGARLSQAFSATARTVAVPADLIQSSDDIFTADNQQAYTNGVGQISPQLMAEVWERYVTIHGERRKRKLLKASAPSAIQIRLGGSKGVLAVNPRLKGKAIILRPSMTKFGSPHHDLEVANSSCRCLPAKLNRPLINALADRGVPPASFLTIQEEAIALIGRARSNFQDTARLCSAYGFGTGCNLHALFEKLHKLGLGAKSVHSGSFFLVMSKAVTAAALGDMKRKARIPVQGATLMGIADEFGFLKEGQVFVQVETVESGHVARRILTGPRLIGRSPTIDPGDIAMVTCVKPPPGHPLLQLRNVVVFDTCSRFQPLPRRLGGGDLDGDLYTVYEDPRLFPPTRQPEAVFHKKSEHLSLHRDCHAHDLAVFFCEYMLNDFIGLVSHLHLRISDVSDEGSHDLRCKELAKLHSRATDFRKTGVAVRRAEMPSHHEPIVPDFLAQGEPREGKLIYSSQRVLGYLYREINWNETDTPSLDKHTDPETGLVTVGAADCFDDDEVLSEYESQLSSLMGDRSTSQPVSASFAGATVGSDVRVTMQQTQTTPSATASMQAAAASPWPFKDVTFPQLLDRISWSFSSFQSAQVLRDTGDDKVVEEGHRYLLLFQKFTRDLRGKSRMLASYHPDVDKPWDGLSGAEAPTSGTLIVSEVHLLTGRLPWAKVSRKTRADRENSTLDNMRATCNRLRKGICSISEAAAFDSKVNKSRMNCSATTVGPEPKAEDCLPSQTSRAGRCEEDGGPAAANHVDEELSSHPSRSQTPTPEPDRLRGSGTATEPFEIVSSDDDDTASVMSESTIDGMHIKGSASVADPGVASSSSATSSSRNDTTSAIKRKASQEAGLERRRSSHTPTPLEPSRLDTSLHSQASIGDTDFATASPSSLRPVSPSPLSQASPALTAVDATELGLDEISAEGQAGNGKARAENAIDSEDQEDGDDDELTPKTTQKIVDSLWKACLFFSSPRRPRYSNVYGYNTFMITLTLHLLSMLETLKHLHRNPLRHGGFRRMRSDSDASSAATYDTESTSNSVAAPQAATSGRIDRVAMRIEGYEEDDEEDFIAFDDEGDIDYDYSLTEAAMAAMDLETVLTDLGPNEHGFDQ